MKFNISQLDKLIAKYIIEIAEDQGEEISQ